MKYQNTKQNTAGNEWDIKFLREFPFMPFGSMMNAWATLHQGQNISNEEFIQVANLIYQEAKAMINERAEATKTSEDKGEDPDIQIAN